MAGNGQRMGQLVIARSKKGTSPNTTDVIGVGATTPDVIAVNSVNDKIQVGA